MDLNILSNFSGLINSSLIHLFCTGTLNNLQMKHTPKQVFEQILLDMTERYQGVSEGKMMASPALQYKSKIFAFYHSNSMVFKLGRDANLKEKYNVSEYKLLSPFRTKVPMKDWFVISEEHIKKWPQMAEDSFIHLS